MHGALLVEQYMALTPDFYAVGYEEGPKRRQAMSAGQVLQGLKDLDTRAHKRSQ